MAVSCMRNASGLNYRNSSFIVDLVMGQIGLPRSTKRISSYYYVISIAPRSHDAANALRRQLHIKQVAQLSQRNRVAGWVSYIRGRLELADNI